MTTVSHALKMADQMKGQLVCTFSMEEIAAYSTLVHRGMAKTSRNREGYLVFIGMRWPNG